jgi:dihydrofolate synthase / folylpolyglutamate synthase
LQTPGNGFIVASKFQSVNSPGFRSTASGNGGNVSLMSTFTQAFSALKALTNYETMVRPPYGGRAMNLPRTRALLKALGHPERDLAILQVAGTKGKGTAATALSAMLRAAGHSTGLYTSPHLLDVRERIAVDGRWISKRAFADGVERILGHVTPLVGTPRCPTFFEMMTVLAILEFNRAGARAAVLEVGLGGRLDATSAVRPLASLVTHVGLDHTHILGRTKALIAAEKAGVAKRGVPLVSGVPAGSAAGRVIRSVAEAVGAPLFVAGGDFTVRTGKPELTGDGPRTAVTVRTPFGLDLTARVPVLARELARDAGLAAAVLSLPRVAKALPVSPEAMAAGLKSLVIPGRMQILSRHPMLLVDGAHNPDSARALARAIHETLMPKRVFAIVGGGVDKAMPAVVTALLAAASKVELTFTRPRTHPRAVNPEELAARFVGAHTCADLPEAMTRARKRARREDLIVVTGSMYLAGEALGM